MRKDNRYVFELPSGKMYGVVAANAKKGDEVLIAAV